MVSVVPSVSTQGWLTTTGEKADKLLGYFFSSEYSQSISYYGEIASLQYLIAKYQSKMDDLKIEITKTLNSLMSGSFEEIQIEVKITPDDESETKYTIYLSARIVDEGTAHDLAHVIKVEDSLIVKIANIGNS